MKQPFRVLFFAALLSPLTVHAEDAPAPPPNEVELGGTHDTLTNNQANWSSAYLDGLHRFGERHSVYGELRQTQRFNLTDRELSGGYYHPLDPTWTALIEASTSPEHNVLPKDSLLGQLQKSFAGGWDMQVGVRRSLYNNASADILVLTGERYWGDFRAAYRLYLSKLQNAGVAPNNNVLFSYYYTTRSNVTFNFAKGRQVESLGPALGVLATDVTTTSLYGLHWLTPSWGVSYEGLLEHEGNLYSRKSIRLGLRYAF